jgi:hypothetical protein
MLIILKLIDPLNYYFLKFVYPNFENDCKSIPKRINNVGTKPPLEKIIPRVYIWTLKKNYKIIETGKLIILKR